MSRPGSRQAEAGGGPSMLVVRLSSLGDVVHALPAVATLKHGFPNSALTWVIHPRWAPLLEGNPFVDRLVLLDRRSAKSIGQAWRALRQTRYEIAVDFQGLVQSALIASLGRADRIFGFHQSEIREKAAALFYSERVRSGGGHVVDRNLELAAATGASTILRAFPLPEGRPEADLPPEPFVLASPLAGWGSKQWPLEFYGVLARLLREELGVTLVLNVSPEGAAVLEEVPGTLRHVCGLSGLIYATRRAAAVLGVDSGPLHLAAALGKRGAAVFGPTDPARNGPYGGEFAILRSPRAVTTYTRRAACDLSMAEIPPQAVFEALRSRLARQPSSAESPA